VPELNLTVCGQTTSIACSEEDEARLLFLVEQVQARAEAARAIVGDNDRWRQLLFAAIFLADELDASSPTTAANAGVQTGIASADRLLLLARQIGASLDRIEANLKPPLEPSQANA
jgi:cell division protein ZapA (FtsZ GTPase activity inhibitor)